MTHYTFDPTEPDGSPRKFIGMHRPPLDAHPPGYVQCTCGDILQVVPAVQSHWAAGHFDVPIYEVNDDDDQIQHADTHS